MFWLEKVNPTRHRDAVRHLCHDHLRLVLHHHSRPGARTAEINGGCYPPTTYCVSGTEGALAVRARSHSVLSRPVVGAIVTFDGGWHWPWIYGTGKVAMLVKVNDCPASPSPEQLARLAGGYGVMHYNRVSMSVGRLYVHNLMMPRSIRRSFVCGRLRGLAEAGRVGPG